MSAFTTPTTTPTPTPTPSLVKTSLMSAGMSADDANCICSAVRLFILKVLFQQLLGYICAGATLASCKLDNRPCNELSCHHYQEQVAFREIQSHFCFHGNDRTRDSRRTLSWRVDRCNHFQSAESKLRINTSCIRAWNQAVPHVITSTSRRVETRKRHIKTMKCHNETTNDDKRMCQARKTTSRKTTSRTGTSPSRPRKTTSRLGVPVWRNDETPHRNDVTT